MKLSKLSKKQLIKKLKYQKELIKDRTNDIIHATTERTKLKNELAHLHDYSALQSKEFDIVSWALQSCENANMEKEKEIEHKDRLLESLIKS